MKISDAHCHYGRECFDGTVTRSKLWANKSYENLKSDWEAYNIESCVLFPQPVPSSLSKYLLEGIFYPFGSGVVRGLKERFSGKVVEYSQANGEISLLEDSRVEYVPFINSRLDGMEELDGVKGVKYYEPFGRLPRKLLSELDRKGLNLIVHISEETVREPGRFLRLVGEFEGVNFQVAHCANGSEKLLDAMEKLPNLYTDTSACTLPIYTEIFSSCRTSFEETVCGNPEKVLFGSDEPWSGYPPQIKQINGLELSKNDREKIFYKNYRKLWA